MISYSPRSNGKVERFDRTLLPSRCTAVFLLIHLRIQPQRWQEREEECVEQGLVEPFSHSIGARQRSIEPMEPSVGSRSSDSMLAMLVSSRGGYLGAVRT